MGRARSPASRDAPPHAALPPRRHWSAARAWRSCSSRSCSPPTPLLVAGVALCAIGVVDTVAGCWRAPRGARARRILVADRVTEGAELHATIEVHRSFARRRLGPAGDRSTSSPDSGSRSAAPSRRCAACATRACSSRRRCPGAASTCSRRRRSPRVTRSTSPAPSRRVAGRRRWCSSSRGPNRCRWTGGNRIRRSDGEDGRLGAEAMAASDLDGLRPYRPGISGQPDPLAGARARAGSDRATAARRRRRAPAGGARHPDADERASRTGGAARRRGARDGLARARARAARADARCCCPASRGRRSSTPSCRRGPVSTPGWRWRAPTPIRIARGPLRWTGSPGASRSST